MPTEAQFWGVGMFANYGFALERPDDYIVILLHNGRGIALLSREEATEENIQAECARHLVMKHGWDGALWKAAK